MGELLRPREPFVQLAARGAEPVLDYVVAHEVAHLAEMNHGPRFWRLVESLSPDSAAARAWLKRHRSRLFSYG